MSYQDLDNELIGLIRSGVRKFHILVNRSRASLPPGVSDRYRAIDRRLQALRRSQRIVHVKGRNMGWFITEDVPGGVDHG